MANTLNSRHFGAIASDCTESMVGPVTVDVNIDDMTKMTQSMIDEVDVARLFGCDA